MKLHYSRLFQRPHITKTVLTILLLFFAAALFSSFASAASTQVVSSTGYLESVGGYYIYGELINQETAPLKINYVTATYYDSQDRQIASTEWHVGTLSMVYPNQKSPFWVLLWNNSAGAVQLGPQVARYELNISAYAVSASQKNVKLLSHTEVYPYPTTLNITGTVQNQGSQNISYQDVGLTCYDNAGKVVYAADAYLSDTYLAPNTVSSFYVLVSTPHLSKIYSCQLTLDDYATSFSVTPPADTPTPSPPPTATPTPSQGNTGTTQTSPPITPKPSTPTPTPTATPTPTPKETPTQTPTPTPITAHKNQEVPASVYAAWAPQNTNVAESTLATVAAVGAVSALSVGASNPASVIGRLSDKIRGLMPEGAKKWLEELLQSKRKQAIAKHDCSQFKITKAEVAAYAVSLVVLTLAFSYVKVPDVSLIYTVLPMVLFTAVVVEVVKTYVLEVYARSKGLWTEHRIWYLGLALFLVTTLSFGVPFSSPTRNIYHSGNLTKKLEGMVGAVAVLVTLAFAGLFFVLLLAGFSVVGGTGLAMCAILGLVDVFPVEPLYGKAVYGFSRGLWVGLFGACVAVYAAWLLFL